MNVNISEKVVRYRISSKNNEEVQEPIGAYIKRERVSQGLNQDYVCKGICSVSYYSRIENSETIPGNDYIEKIFKKLNKPIPTDYTITIKNQEMIDRFLSAIEFKNEKLIEETYDEIKKTEQKHELYDLVYCIIKGNNDEAERLIKLLHEQQRYFDNEELLLYLEMIGNFCINKLEMEKAEKYLFLAIKLQSTMNIEKPLIFYKYAWVLGKNNNDLKCIDYATKASELFKCIKSINFMRKVSKHFIY
ncbi:MAG: Helix-turn-helix domain protein [Haloplasmataceae bacterium]|nr:Helix-turn-helix domain protein [Haloplasmataceae bacterium]